MNWQCLEQSEAGVRQVRSLRNPNRCESTSSESIRSGESLESSAVVTSSSSSHHRRLLPRDPHATNSAMLMWFCESVGSGRPHRCRGVSLHRVPTPKRFSVRSRSLLSAGSSHDFRSDEGVLSSHRIRESISNVLLPQLRNFGVLDFREESRACRRCGGCIRRSVVSGADPLSVGAVNAFMDSHRTGATTFSQGPNQLSALARDH